MAGSDYTTSSATLDFTGKLSDGDTIRFTVPVNDDSLLEPVEDFTASLSAITGGLVTINDTTATATITDNDAASVSIADVSINEDAGSAVFVVSLSGNVQDAFTVDVATADNSALAGSDYTTSSATLDFTGKLSDGDTIRFTVPISDDSLLEPVEDFTASLSAITGGLVAINDTTATATITDNDAASVSIADVSINEDAGSAVFVVSLSGNVQDAFTVNVATADNSALAGSDYTTSSATLDFAGKLSDGDTIRFTVPVNDDSLLEPVEDFTASLSAITGGLVAINDTTATATITDNDAASVSIADVSINEDAGSAVFVVSLSGNVQDAFTVNVATADNSALAGSDYTTSSATLDFTGKLSDGDTIRFTVPVNDDSLLEPVEDFTASLSAITGGLVTINDTTATATITDNDAASVSIADVSINEDAGSAVFVVSLSGNVQDAFTVNVATADNSALAGSDYTTSSATLDFAGKLSDGDTIRFT
nr:Calx-beta domain-containing protein [uncultured Draconibacterium sp.]